MIGLLLACFQDVIKNLNINPVYASINLSTQKKNHINAMNVINVSDINVFLSNIKNEFTQKKYHINAMNAVNVSDKNSILKDTNNCTQ